MNQSKRTERDLCLSINTKNMDLCDVFIFLNEIFKNLCQSDENSAKKKESFVDYLENDEVK
mgnify:CR=1 FL=1